MCIKVESSFILINKLKNRESCTIGELVKTKGIIESDIPSVYVDVSKKSILSSVASYPEIFSWESDQVRKKENSFAYFEEPYITYFGNNIESSVKSKIKEILEFGKI